MQRSCDSMPKREIKKLKTIVPNLAMLAFLLIATGCSKDPELVRRVAVAESLEAMSKCEKVSGAGHLPNLAIASVVNAQNETTLKLVAYAANSPVEFPVPFYRLSAGRWLIGDKDRVYLMDEHCRSFDLKDRRPPEGKKFPPEGILRLNPGESFEMTFSFYRLNDATRFGMLVYAGKTLTFIVNSPNTSSANKT